MTTQIIWRVRTLGGVGDRGSFVKVHSRLGRSVLCELLEKVLYYSFQINLCRVELSLSFLLRVYNWGLLNRILPFMGLLPLCSSCSANWGINVFLKPIWVFTPTIAFLIGYMTACHCCISRIWCMTSWDNSQSCILSLWWRLRGEW